MSLPDKINIRVIFEDGKRTIRDFGESFKDLEEGERNQILELLSHAPDEAYIHLSETTKGYRLERPSEGHAVLPTKVSVIDYAYITINEEDPEKKPR